MNRQRLLIYTRNLQCVLIEKEKVRVSVCIKRYCIINTLTLGIMQIHSGALFIRVQHWFSNLCMYIVILAQWFYLTIE